MPGIAFPCNDSHTGQRVMRSIAHRELGIMRAMFTQRRSPYVFMPVLNMSLFLSANEDDVRHAIVQGYPAGQVLDSAYSDDDGDELRIAFDFDGVLADDESDQVLQRHGLQDLQQYEIANAVTAHSPGPLRDFLSKINKVNDAFFLGGISKGLIMPVLRPHIFFDDQKTHLLSTAHSVPSVHVPFGNVNQDIPCTGTTVAQSAPSGTNGLAKCIRHT